MKREWKLFIQLFWSFFKIGPVTFGGGYAMIPLIEREVVKRRKWVKVEDVSDLLALSGTVPGAIAVNAATLIGHRIAGICGAIAAMIGVLLPTFIIMILLNVVFVSLQGNPHVEAAFLGIRASVVALIVYAAIKMAPTSILDKSTATLTISMVLIMVMFHWNPILVIFAGALLGIIIVKVKTLLNITVKLDRKTIQESKSRLN